VNHLIVMHNPVQGHQVMRDSLWPWAKAMLTAGHKLVIRGEEAEDAKSIQQRKYLHGVIFTEMAEQIRPNGQSFQMKVWKEHCREKFLGSRWVVRVDPLTGKKRRRKERVSSEDLGIRAYGAYIEQCTAYAVTEFGCEFSVKRWEDYQ
jgi:hypothetical protein